LAKDWVIKNAVYVAHVSFRAYHSTVLAHFKKNIIAVKISINNLTSSGELFLLDKKSFSENELKDI
jgi:hypothetical protein